MWRVRSYTLLVEHNNKKNRVRLEHDMKTVGKIHNAKIWRLKLKKDTIRKA